MRILLLIPVWFVLALLIPTIWAIVRIYRTVRGSHPVICPHTGLGASLELHAPHSVGMRILGNPMRQIRFCSALGEGQTCSRSCLSQLETAA